MGTDWESLVWGWVHKLGSPWIGLPITICAWTQLGWATSRWHWLSPWHPWHHPEVMQAHCLWCIHITSEQSWAPLLLHLGYQEVSTLGTHSHYFWLMWLCPGVAWAGATTEFKPYESLRVAGEEVVHEPRLVSLNWPKSGLDFGSVWVCAHP